MEAADSVGRRYPQVLENGHPWTAKLRKKKTGFEKIYIHFKATEK